MRTDTENRITVLLGIILMLGFVLYGLLPFVVQGG